ILFCRNTAMIREIPVVTSVVRENSGKIPMAVASSSTRAMVMATIEALNLRKHFAAVVTFEDVRHPKPAPDTFLEAARRLGVHPSQCLVFEDSEQGLDAAKRAHMIA